MASAPTFFQVIKQLYFFGHALDYLSNASGAVESLGNAISAKNAAEAACQDYFNNPTSDTLQNLIDKYQQAISEQ